jgi:lipoprotein signal peptidase
VPPRDPEQSASACSSPSRVSPHALHSPAAVALFVVLTVAALAGDLLSKHFVFAALLNDPSLPQRIEGLKMRHGLEDLPPQQVLAELRLYRQIVPGLRFTLSTNPGVVFGTPMAWPLVSGATILTVVLVVVFFAWSSARAHWTHVALAWIAAGALGNLYDRLLTQVRVGDLEPIRHQVRDFIDCSQIGYRWIFNLADAYLVIGVGMLILHWLWDGRRSARARATR